MKSQLHQPIDTPGARVLPSINHYYMEWILLSLSSLCSIGQQDMHQKAVAARLIYDNLVLKAGCSRSTVAVIV
jgi:hypothetical protein